MDGQPGPFFTLDGAIDGFHLPARIEGWVTKREDGVLGTDLHIEVRDGETVLGRCALAGARPDVTGDTVTPAAFSLDCSGFTDADALLDGSVVVAVVDAAGRSRRLEIYPPTRRRITGELALTKLRTADATAASAALEALMANPLLAGAAGTAIERSRRLLGQSASHARWGTAASTGPLITFIGAGSTVFAKNLLGDILSEPDLAGSRIRLYDIDAERLGVSETVARRIADTLGSPADIVATTDLGRALDGADYAINMIQVGGYRPCTVTDFDLPRRAGLRQTIADTLGIGGIMRALRTIPVLVRMAGEMERRCPDVLHLNYTNPMAMNCWALGRASRVRTVGLCHSVQGTAAQLAQAVGVPVEALSYTVAGINHMAFYLRLSCNGEDLYPRLRQLLAEDRVPPEDRVRYDLLGRFGFFVTESSEHFAEYVPWYIKRCRDDLIAHYNIPLDEYPRRCELQMAEWGALATELQDRNRPLSVTRSHEYGARIIHAVETGQPAVIYGNVPNDGLIDNLPAGCCVEVPCLVDAGGIQPVRMGALPIQLAALMQTNVNVQSLTVEAALTGRREHVLHAAMLDPHTAADLDPDQIATLVDAMLEAHRPWLPDALFAAG